MTIANIPSDQILTTVIQFLADALAACEIPTCKTVRWHAEPERLYCCDCTDASAYTIVGWIAERFDGDGLLARARNFVCPRLDVLDVRFTVARCWPQPLNDLIDGDPRDAASAELALVLDCLVDAFGLCNQRPDLFNQACSKIAAQGWTALRQCTPRAPVNNVVVEDCCAGWRGSILIA